MRLAKRVGRMSAMVGSVCVLSVSAVMAGDLDPPPGAVDSTMRTLLEVEPRIPVGAMTTPGDGLSTHVISVSGSYYLTGDVTQASGKDGIRIDASGVSLDLRGFTVRGVSGDGHGITAGGSARHLHVHNGTIETFDLDGVRLHFVPDCVFENLRVWGNGGEGMWVGGGSTLRSCISSENGQNGFLSNGIVAMEGCTAEGNAIDGFDVSGTLENCVSIANIEDGFEVWVGAISDCLSHGNSGKGFVVGATGSVTLESCSARLNETGFSAIGESSFMHCSARQGLTDGFTLSAGCTMVSCTARSNGDDGFQLATGSSVHECRSELNGYGFYVPAGESMVRVDSCTATWSTNTGFLVSGDLCLVVRNFARGNGTDYNLSGTSQNGPIESATGTIVSTSPWANFGELLPASVQGLEAIKGKSAEMVRPVLDDADALHGRRLVEGAPR